MPPAPDRELADVVTGAHIPDLHPAPRLAQDAHDLLFTVSALFHGVLFPWFRSQNYILQQSSSQGVGQRPLSEPESFGPDAPLEAPKKKAK
ncbi:MAG: hypothetical protein JNM65_08725 [Verrucomicrobiaceae bacterium]|nr:hypothetical protein [Verrucomicrobiaceae bacterium]